MQVVDATHVLCHSQSLELQLNGREGGREGRGGGGEGRGEEENTAVSNVMYLESVVFSSIE